jgi:hypothetical protein
MQEEVRGETVSTAAIPLPVLGALTEAERAAKRVAGVLVDAVIASWFDGLFYLILSFLLGLTLIVPPNGNGSLHQAEVTMFLYFGCASTLSLGFAFSSRSRTKSLWWLRLITAVMGLFLFPVGTLHYAFFIRRWLRPETKAWFGIKDV